MATGRAKTQESTKTPEMQSLASSDPESSNTVESPSGIDVLSSPRPSSVSPGSVSPEASTDHQNISRVDTVASPRSVSFEASIDHPKGSCVEAPCYWTCFVLAIIFCSPCIVVVGGVCLLSRLEGKLSKLFIFFAAVIGIIISIYNICIYFPEDTIFWEIFYATFLVLYCFLVSGLKRGRYSKSFSCSCLKRNEGDGNPSVTAHGQDRTRDTVSSESRMDVPEQPQAVQTDFDVVPGTSAIGQGESFPMIDESSSE